MMLHTLNTGLQEVKCFHHNLGFKACVYATVMSLYHESAVNCHSVSGVHWLGRRSGKYT